MDRKPMTPGICRRVAYTYTYFLRLTLNRVISQLGRDAIADLPPECLSHIGACYRLDLSPADCAALIISDLRCPS